MVIAIEGALSALLQDLDVAVAERDFTVARNTLDVGGHVLSVLDRDADILSVEVRAAGQLPAMCIELIGEACVPA